jgi:type I restriction enzyme S subunit
MDKRSIGFSDKSLRDRDRKMPGDWIEYKTSELIANGKLAIGDGYRAKNSELVATGLPFARAGNINNGFLFNDADLFPEKDLPRVGEKVSRLGDVVFTSKGTVGRFAFVKETTPQFVYSPQLCYWRSLDHGMIDPRFLYYWMNGREFWGQASGVKCQTDMADYVSLTDQRRMKVTLPPIAEQRAIAHILGALDDKIELNRKMNETLETLMRAIFKSWFVDFDPVRAKAEGRKPYGMDAETAALFPDSFQDSPLGKIPKGGSLKSCMLFVLSNGTA